MRMGVLGGTFDPAHNAHIALAQAAVSQLRLDKLLVIPSGDPPYKKCRASARDRLAIARAAFRDVPGAEVSDIEAVRPGQTYAVDTMRTLRGKFPDAEIIYILGADAIRKVQLWYGFDELRAMCGFAYAARAGAGEPLVAATQIMATIPDISSSEIRDIVLRGGNIARLAPDAAREFIAERGLYLTDRAEEELTQDLAARLSPKRMLHTLGVRDAAVALARRNGIPGGKARIAGLLHDCAKYLPDAELLRRADAAGADALEKLSPQVLHAPIGAQIARDQYSVRDPEILSAIRRHTVGGRGMALLDAIVYVADFIEPNRSDFPGLERARSLARADIWQATAECARLTCAYAGERGQAIHPATFMMIKEIEDGGTNNG